MHFRLITWNIHKGIGGMDGAYNIGRIIETLHQCRPDIVHLQEVDDDAPRSRHHRQVDVLADALEMPHRAYQRNVTLRRGGYGNAVISRFPLRHAHDLDLTIRFKKRRGAQILICSVPLGHDHVLPVHLVNLHLGLIEFEQKIQLRRLLACHEVKSLDAAKPLIVAGDMNDVLGRLGRHILEPKGFRDACNGKATFPAFLPLRALDQIFYRGPLEMRRCFISRSDVARRASDHLPLIVDFDVVRAQHSETPHVHGAEHKSSG